MYKRQLPDNSAPYFIEDPVIGSDAKVQKEYSSTLAGTAIDPDPDDSLTYTLVEGPSWLTLAGDGALGGTPLPSDEGINQFTIQVTDSAGNSDQATLIVTVLLATNVSVVADTYIRGGSSADNNYGSEPELTIKTESASYTRHAYLRFDYQSLGGGALEKVDLLVTPSAICTDTGDIVLRARLLNDADDYWDEYSMTWNTAPTPSAEEVSVNGPFQVGTEIELDVTSLLNRAGNTNGIATIVLDANNGSGSQRWLELASREHATTDWHASLDVVKDAPINIPPEARFSSSVSDLEVTITDTSTDLDGTITAWSWDFGDGNTSTDQNPIHTYLLGGEYGVSLTVTDSDGDSDTNTQSVTVTEPVAGPPAAPSNLVASVTQTGKGKNKVKEVTLNWNDNSNDEIHFVVERCQETGQGRNKDCPWADLTTTTLPTFNEGGLQGTFKYRVRAENAEGQQSATSNEVKI